DCCRNIETGKVAPLIIDQKEAARSFGQKGRDFNEDSYKYRDWLFLNRTTKRAFC
ncbi:Hypothetical protein FKW44_011886, partial [Caligus rogercresseyi]